MADEIGVLGVAASAQGGSVTMARVVVRLTSDDSISVERLESWQATARDEARSMADLVDSLVNVLDRKRTGAPIAVAVKRTETTMGRPSNAYDQKIRAEGAAMIAASSQGRGYYGFRTNQLGHGRKLQESAAACTGYPDARLDQEAVAAACTALADLVSQGELDD